MVETLPNDYYWLYRGPTEIQYILGLSVGNHDFIDPEWKSLALIIRHDSEDPDLVVGSENYNYYVAIRVHAILILLKKYRSKEEENELSDEERLDKQHCEERWNEQHEDLIIQYILLATKSGPFNSSEQTQFDVLYALYFLIKILPNIDDWIEYIQQAYAVKLEEAVES